MFRRQPSQPLLLRLPLGSQWRWQIQTALTEVENSLLLRVLVQALVVVGIVATDIAAETQFSLWAVPLSLVGAAWSWYRRQNRNISVKFCIAFGMLVALGAFFSRLVGELNDTRLVLSELLIQLQVLHSFDLPRRKDLGYSMVIGLILLGVAGTLSQTLAFAPVLLLFLAIALPVLVLDCRSRLGFTKAEVSPSFTWSGLRARDEIRFYFVLFTLVIGLGLLIFAFLPRLPGYQLRTFPVSVPINVEGKFDGRRIVNPGYVRKGNDNGGTGTGFSQQSGKANSIDDTFYYGFDSRINQNLRGELKPKVVMRVRSQAEGFWRVLAFDRYTGQGWEISRNQQVQTIKRSNWSYQISLPPPLVAARTKEVVQTYTLVSEFPNLIPALAYPQQLYFPTPEVAVDSEGGLRAPVGLTKDLTYTVVSEVPYRDRTLLKQASTQYSQNIRDHYLQVPPQIAEKVRQRTQEILATSSKLTTAFEQSLYLAQYLKQHYSISSDPLALPLLGKNEDLVEAFLFKYKGGYPDHFSTALTIMLRSIGIPARLVAGFSPGEFNPFTGLYVVRNTDAYTMTEVYFPKYGWFTFDPIPGHPLIPPSIEEYQTFSVLQHFWKWVAGWLPTPVVGLLNGVFSTLFNWLAGAIAWFLALFSSLPTLLSRLIVATGLSFFGWLSWNQWRVWRYRHWLANLPPMESLYQQMVGWATSKGWAKHPTQTPLEYARTLHQHHPPAIAKIIDEISQAYTDWRYGEHAPNLKQLRQQLRQLKTPPSLTL